MIPILFNPSSGGGKALKYKTKIENLFLKNSIKYKLYISKSEKHLRELVKEVAVKDEVELIAVAGGDSTFTIVANELIGRGFNKPMAMIGIGSSNDIPKEFNLETIEKTVSAIKRKKIKIIDLGLIESSEKNKTYFIGQANIGLGAFVNRAVEKLNSEKKRLPQMIQGVYSIIQNFKNKEIPINLYIEFDSKKRDISEWTIALFSNIRYWATGKLVLPDAMTDDGFLDGFFLKKTSFPGLIKLGILASKGKHTKDRRVLIEKAREYTIKSETPFFIQVDGDIIGGWKNPKIFNQVKIKNVPKKLKIIIGS
jgi:diacylglycerol kinase family enzyme